MHPGDWLLADVESLLNELVAWIEDPNDTMGSGKGLGWRAFEWWADGDELPTEMGETIEVLRSEAADIELRRLQSLLIQAPAQVAELKAEVAEKWGELPDRDMQRLIRSKLKIDLSEFYLTRLDYYIGHHEVQPVGEFEGIADLVEFLVKLPLLSRSKD